MTQWVTSRCRGGEERGYGKSRSGGVRKLASVLRWRRGAESMAAGRNPSPPLNAISARYTYHVYLPLIFIIFSIYASLSWELSSTTIQSHVTRYGKDKKEGKNEEKKQINVNKQMWVNLYMYIYFILFTYIYLYLCYNILHIFNLSAPIQTRCRHLLNPQQFSFSSISV